MLSNINHSQKGRFYGLLLSFVAIFLALPNYTFAQVSDNYVNPNPNKLPFLREASSGDVVSHRTLIDQSNDQSGDQSETPVPSNPPVVNTQPDILLSQNNGCGFNDISGHKSENAINQLYNRRVVGGRTPCNFVPDAPATRAEVTTMVVRAKKVPVKKAVKSGPLQTKPFPDSEPQAWSTPLVEAAKDADVVHGYPDGLFRADQEINMVENLKILSRGFDLNYVSVSTAEMTQIEDIELNQWYVPYVQAGLDSDLPGLVDEYNKLYPAKNLTRAEIAEMVYYLILNYD